LREPAWLWLVVLGSVLGLIVLDTVVFGRRERGMPVKEAVLVSLGWIAIAVLFGFGVLVLAGRQAFEEYFTAYLLEKGLALDNVFVFSLIFAYFAVPREYEHRVLFDPWGITVALVSRIVFILAGIALIEHFRWSTYLLGAIVLLTGLRLLTDPSSGFRPERSLSLRALARLFPVVPDFAGERFFARVNGRIHATQLMVVLVAVETSEIIFSFDSVPAVLGVTDKAFLIFSSNAFAILGFRSLYFVLAGLRNRFTYVRVGVSLAVILVGVKLLLSKVVHLQVWIGLALAIGLVTVSVLVSFLVSPRPAESETMA
jgi:TerC family integral membrane protein